MVETIHNSFPAVSSKPSSRSSAHTGIIAYTRSNFVYFRLWFYVLRLVASISLAGILFTAKIAGFPYDIVPIFILVGFQLAINFIEEGMYQSGFDLRKLFAFTSVLDVLVITTAVYFSGGSTSFLWPAYLLVILSEALVSSGITLSMMGLSVIAYGAVVFAQAFGLLHPFGALAAQVSLAYLIPPLVHISFLVMLGVMGWFYFAQLRGEQVSLYNTKEELKQKNVELEDLKNNLENTVRARTKELEETKDALESYIGKQGLI